MVSLIETLVTNKPVILDGAWGTQLQALGLPPGACPDEWNLSNPKKVESVARAYAEAGSQVVLTNTFGANRLTLAGHDLSDKCAEINIAGVKASKRGAGALAKVFASIGPTGKMLVTGQTSEDELKDVFSQQADALAKGGADALVIETMSDPVEAAIAVASAKQTGLPVVGCMVFDSGKNHDRTMMGTTPEDAAKALEDAGADVIGSNCGQGIEGFIAICQRLKASTSKPIWIKANAGLPEMIDGKISYDTSTEQFAKYAAELLKTGASFIGGCCGTSPDFIRALQKEFA